MSINQKIVDKIAEKTKDEKLKMALLEIIDREIKGLGNFTDKYDSIIIKSIEKEEENSEDM